MVAFDERDGLGSLGSPEKDKTGRIGDQKKVHDRLGFQRKKREFFRLMDRNHVPCESLARTLLRVYQVPGSHWKEGKWVSERRVKDEMPESVFFPTRLRTWR